MLLGQSSAAEVSKLEQPLWRDGGSLWLPPQSSPTAVPSDNLFDFIFWVSVFFFFLIVGLMIFYVIRYRRRVEGEGPQSNITHNTTLEIVWTAIPLILVMVMFVLAFRAYVYIETPPSNSYQILVTGQKWNWLFEYPSNGAVSPTLAVPVDTPIELVMTSVDVTHSMYIPDFRVKKDVVPGRYSKLWFEANEVGQHHIFCAEYCGTKHSMMISMVDVMNAGDFQAWLAKKGNPFEAGKSYAEIGQSIYKGKGGCFQCHSIDGTAGNGPSWARMEGDKRHSIFGHAVDVRINGKGSPQQVTVDENYIRESIFEPNAKVVSGFNAIMNTYKGILSDREVTAVIEFIKSLDDNYEPLLVPEDPNSTDEATPADESKPKGGEAAPADDNDGAPVPPAETAESAEDPQGEVS